MNSVWWVFKQLWYALVMTLEYFIFPTCGTPLSNFEANSNYKDVSDMTVTVTFISKDPKLCVLARSPQVKILVWTTTPWTLVANTSLCVNPDLKYSIVSYEDSAYLCASDLIDIF